MSSLKKMIAVLELVSDEKMSWTPEEIAKELKVSLPTARYPEGMTRIALFGDPTKALGTVAEAECARRHTPDAGTNHKPD